VLYQKIGALNTQDLLIANNINFNIDIKAVNFSNYGIWEDSLGNYGGELVKEYWSLNKI
tara:strand:+ start:524 stop:700 length:177 start_codon:yes stop_codon:yes gene_type:complete